MRIVHSRPDIACAVNKLTQVTEKQFCEQQIKDYNKLVRYLQKTKSQALRYSKLDMDSLRLVSFFDACFALNADLSPQLGYLILLCDKHNNANVLNFNSYKSRRVVRSVMGGETYAFSGAFDISYTMRYDLKKNVE